MAKENERKEAKERKRKQDGGLLINPLGNTARAREAPALHVQLRGGRGCGGGDRRQLLPALREGLCAVGVVLPVDVLEEALERLPERDKAFVRDVLGGKRWGEMGMPKATFYRRLEKVVERVRLTHWNPSL